MTLASAISACKEEKILSSRTCDLASVIRDYRNLIHPGKVIREEERPTSDSAQVSLSLVHVVLREISVFYAKKSGFTAQQMLNKIEIDPNSSRIAKHLIRDMTQREIRKLLCDIIPNRYFDYSQKLETVEEFDEEERISRWKSALRSTFHSAFSLASNSVKRDSSEKMLYYLREGSEEIIGYYMKDLFRFSYISYLDNDDKQFVIAHVLSQCEEYLMHGEQEMFEGISKHLKSDSALSLYRNISNIWFKHRESDLEKKMRKLLRSIMIDLNDEAKAIIYEYIEKKIKRDAKKNDGVRTSFGQMLLDIVAVEI